jgi:hypothetical protein
MDFRLPGRSEVYTVECLVRTGRSHLCLFALDDFESLEPPVEEGTNFEQPVQVNFKRNFIKFGGKDIPLYRIDGMPCVVPEIVSGTSLASGASGATAAAAVHAGSEEQASWEFVHRILAHASPDYCERTVRKASGLPKSLAKSSRPCPECALGKMKAPRKGQGELSTGLPKPSGPGQQFSSDIFGPVFGSWTERRALFYYALVRVLRMGCSLVHGFEGSSWQNAGEHDSRSASGRQSARKC